MAGGAVALESLSLLPFLLICYKLLCYYATCYFATTLAYMLVFAVESVCHQVSNPDRQRWSTSTQAFTSSSQKKVPSHKTIFLTSCLMASCLYLTLPSLPAAPSLNSCYNSIQTRSMPRLLPLLHEIGTLHLIQNCKSRSKTWLSKRS